MQEHLFLLSPEQIVDLLLMGKPISQGNVSVVSNSSLLTVINMLHAKMEELKNKRVS